MQNLPSLDQLDKLICEMSLLEYVKWSFFQKHKREFRVNHHHVTLCDALEQVYYGKIVNLVINVAPRYSKTEICVKAFIEWCILKTNGVAKFIHLTYAQSLALDSSSEIREDIKSDWYQQFWKIGIKRDSDAKEKWYTEAGGGVYATGTMGTITGFGAGAFEEVGFHGAIIVDDPLKPDEAHSDDVRAKANERLNSTILSRKNHPSKTPFILIMQRLHEKDMSGFVLGGGTDLDNVVHICMPAIMEDGSPLWAEKHNLTQLEAIKKASVRIFTGQYMQAPAPAEGNVLKRNHFKTYKILPARVDKFIFSIDCAFKDKKDSDFVVFQMWAKVGGEFYLVDQVRDRMSFTATKTALIAFCNKHPKVIRKLIEDKANGTAIIDSLKEKISGIIPINPTESKQARVEAVSDLFEAGNVYFPEDAPWLNDLIEECVIFPNGDHDDQVDALSQALTDLFGKRTGNFTDEMLAPKISNNTINKGQW